jgi:uncharacterized protein (DUF169 family)
MKLGMSIAAWEVAETAISRAEASTSNPPEAKPVLTATELNRYGEDLEKLLILRTSPIAVKMLQKEADIPKGAIRPKKDQGIHLAQCQAFAMSRRQKMTIAMLKEDSWCPAPISGYGIVKPPEDYVGFPAMIENQEASKRLEKASPAFEFGKYIGVLSAPLKNAGFDPDVVLVYCNAAQLRSLLFSVKYKEGVLVKSEFDPLRSCVFSIVPTMLTGEFRITVPDSGEQVRAMPAEDEMIFTIPGKKLEALVSGLQHFEGMRFGYTQLTYDMRPDFAQPDHYKKIFKIWGLDAGK